MNENRTPGMNAPGLLDISVKVYPVKEPGKLLAFASASLGGIFEAAKGTAARPAPAPEAERKADKGAR